MQKNMEFYLFDNTGQIESKLTEWDKVDFTTRFKEADPSLWLDGVNSGDEVAELTNRLGWLTLPERMLPEADEIMKFADDIRSEFDEIILLGMGGSSLAPQMFMETIGNREGYPALTVLDTTNPETIMELASSIDPDRTLFIVSSKSGGTIETLSLYTYFYAFITACGIDAGSRFIAITDPGSKLQKTAEEKGFLRVFLADPEVGGRFSALSHFGMVPAALTGLDIKSLLESARVYADEQISGPGSEPAESLRLGAAIGLSAESAIDKISFHLSDSLLPFGDWVEQLISESLGKNGKGMVPVINEPVDTVLKREDTFHVLMSIEGDDGNENAALVEKLKKGRKPHCSISLSKTADLMSELMKWEIATASAATVMRINPFDQPNVESAKARARELMSEYSRTRKLPEQKPALSGDGITLYSTVNTPGKDIRGSISEFTNNAGAGDYIALMAYLPYDMEIDDLLVEFRENITENTSLPVTLGYGPRFLHSSGQLHKGGKNNGLFIQISHEISEDLDVPGKDYSFGVLITSQLWGDYSALRDEKRRVLHIRLKGDIREKLEEIVNI